MSNKQMLSSFSYGAAIIAVLISAIAFYNDNLPAQLHSALHLNSHVARLLHPMTKPTGDAPEYKVQIFSHDPLVIIIDSFVSSSEIDHLLAIGYAILHQCLWDYLPSSSQDDFETSKVYAGYGDGIVDPEKRISESAKLNSTDPIVRRIQQRAHSIVGWRGATIKPQALTLERYRVDGFYDYHYDWDPTLKKGNRVSTFMVYAVADCEAGGTNFPYLPRPNDTRWCDVIECTEEGIDGFQGTTFKPRPGSAIFWENFYPNGTGHPNVYHAGLPVKSGVKVGLNIWFWDSAWRAESEEITRE